MTVTVPPGGAVDPPVWRRRVPVAGGPASPSAGTCPRPPTVPAQIPGAGSRTGLPGRRRDEPGRRGLLVVLDCLGPDERVASVLHDGDGEEAAPARGVRKAPRTPARHRCVVEVFPGRLPRPDPRRAGPGRGAARGRQARAAQCQPDRGGDRGARPLRPVRHLPRRTGLGDRSRRPLPRGTELSRSPASGSAPASRSPTPSASPGSVVRVSASRPAP